jgi:hypothetical protein
MQSKSDPDGRKKVSIQPKTQEAKALFSSSNILQND